MHDVVIDDPPGAFCYGSTSGLFRTCFVQAPTAAWSPTSNITLDTDQASSCDAVLGSPSALLCVIVRAAIYIGATYTLRAYGSRPLVLISAGTFQVDGRIDVSSNSGTADERGAGGSPSSCASPSNALLKGGGAGGSFGTSGGGGGGGDGQHFGGAPAPAIPSLTSVRGGCGGGRGEGGNTPAGIGGGAVYLITPGVLVIEGGINASGGGGPGGAARGGGSGGGAGGLIGIDASNLVGGGYLLADGGGGGCGGDSIMSGTAGEVALHQRPPMGCRDSAVSGGDGAFGETTATAGGDGVSQEGGGGGGGGAGIIALFPPTLTIVDRSPP
jgi:hypothetical protein